MSYSTLSALFTDIANAIRGKTGSTTPIAAEDFPTEISNISSGGKQIFINTVLSYQSSAENRVKIWIPVGTTFPAGTAVDISIIHSPGSMNSSQLRYYQGVANMMIINNALSSAIYCQMGSINTSINLSSTIIQYENNSSGTNCITITLPSSRAWVGTAAQASQCPPGHYWIKVTPYQAP